MKKIFFTVLISVLSLGANAFAMMGGGPMMGGGFAMTNSGGFGMMNGMSGAPVVDDSGTAYVVTHNPAATAGSVPDSNSFESTVSAVSVSGQITSITLKGIVSRPVVFGGVLAATASLPDPSQYAVAGNLGSNAGRQSVLYILPLPFTSSSVPIAVTLDGQFASMPVVEDSHIYITTSDFGNAMMNGNSMFNNMYGNYNFNGTGQAKSFLYIINFDGSLASKVQLP